MTISQTVSDFDRGASPSDGFINARGENSYLRVSHIGGIPCLTNQAGYPYTVIIILFAKSFSYDRDEFL